MKSKFKVSAASRLTEANNKKVIMLADFSKDFSKEGTAFSAMTPCTFLSIIYHQNPLLLLKNLKSTIAYTYIARLW